MKLLEEAESKLTAARQRGVELESACSRMESRLEDASRRLQTEQEDARCLRGSIEKTANERDKLQVGDDFLIELTSSSLQLEVEELAKTKSQLQKGNKYLEKKYLATVTERDEVNSNCNKLVGDIRELEQKLRSLESDSASIASKLQVGECGLLM